MIGHSATPKESSVRKYRTFNVVLSLVMDDGFHVNYLSRADL